MCDSALMSLSYTLKRTLKYFFHAIWVMKMCLNLKPKILYFSLLILDEVAAFVSFFPNFFAFCSGNHADNPLPVPEWLRHLSTVSMEAALVVTSK